MRKCRICFQKTGRAIYISHLDLMRTMQRAFTRADISICHTEGFNPHPRMVFALPLSVGMSSDCELLDVEIENDISFDKIPSLLNLVLPEGIVVKTAYAPERKFKEIVWLTVSGKMEYDQLMTDDLLVRLGMLFSQDTLVISKKSKKGFTDFDLIPCIQTIDFQEIDPKTFALTAIITAQDPALNPENLINAIRQHMPELAPDFTSFHRIELRDVEFELFR